MDTILHKKIYKQIKASSRILLIPHQNPDGDAVGSVVALAHMLKNMNIVYDIYCLTDVPHAFAFLPYARYISQDIALWNYDYDSIIVCDSGDPGYAGIAHELERKKSTTTIINIDHHASNTFFGDINLVDTKASSTTEVLYHFLHSQHIEINPAIATALLTGLVYDTQNFSNAGTSLDALSIASKLVQKGARNIDIRKYLINNKKIHVFALWSRILMRLEEHNETNIIYTFITQQDIRECNAHEDDISGVANLLNDLSYGKASLVLREKEGGSIKGSLRTTYDDVDVSSLAMSLGGGGHKKASGFSLEGPFDESLKLIWSKLELFAKKGYTL